jgi:hypothetical protein
MRHLKKCLALCGVALMVMSFDTCRQARAGDGADLGSLQTYIDGVCTAFSMTTCPKLPTIAQAVLEVVAMVDIAPEAVRSSTAFSIPVGPYVDAGNPSHPPGIGCSSTGCIDPLNPISTFPVDPKVLSSLRPLAFISAGKGNGAARPTQLYDSDADAFLYAVGALSKANAGSPAPDTLLLFYDKPGWTDSESKQALAKISLPLSVLNKDGASERFVAATLLYKKPGTKAAPCSASSVMGSFSGAGTQTLSPTAIGINCAVVFAPSPVSAEPHAIFEVSIPILITSLDAPIIAGSPIGFGSPFVSGVPGFTPVAGILGTTGRSIGIGPNAGPFGVPASQTVPGTFALCASLPSEDNDHVPVPAISAFYAIAGDGEVITSAPLAAGVPIVCPLGL